MLRAPAVMPTLMSVPRLRSARTTVAQVVEPMPCTRSTMAATVLVALLGNACARNAQWKIEKNALARWHVEPTDRNFSKKSWLFNQTAFSFIYNNFSSPQRTLTFYLLAFTKGHNSTIVICRTRTMDRRDGYHGWTWQAYICAIIVHHPFA